MYELVGSGFLIAEAIKEIGITRQTYSLWRKNHPEFKAKIDSIKVLTSGAAPERWDGDFIAFRKKFFGFDTSDFQAEMIHHIEDAEPGTITEILVPPEHGKTTTLTDWCNKTLAVDPNHKILYVSETAKYAAKVAGRIRRRMTEQQLAHDYIMHFGPFYEPGQAERGLPWTDMYFTVCRAMIDSQEYSFEAVGILNSQIYGTRPDTVICDDFQTLRTINQTDKILERFQQDVVTRPPMGEGKIVIIMTRLGNRDVAVELIKRDIVSYKNFYMRPAMNSKGEPLWHERFTKDMLMARRKQVGEKIWNRAYMMKPQQDGTATFDEQLLENAKDTSRVYGITTKIDDIELPRVAGLDPALGGGCALTVCSWGDHLDVIDTEVRYELGKNEDIYAFIEEFHTRYQFSDIVIEAVGFQKGIARDERLTGDDGLEKKLGFRIHEHTTGVNKLDEVSYGVAAMVSSFIQGEIWIPWGDDKTAQRMEPLVMQLLDWRPFIPTRYIEQDLVMSLWFIWKWWMGMRRSAESYTEEAFKSQGMPFTPLASPGRTVYAGQRY